MGTDPLMGGQVNFAVSASQNNALDICTIIRRLFLSRKLRYDDYSLIVGKHKHGYRAALTSKNNGKINLFIGFGNVPELAVLDAIDTLLYSTVDPLAHTSIRFV